MPFIEIIDRDATEEKRELATKDITDGLCQAFGIKPEIITCYYFSMPHYSYGHAGKYSTSAEKFRYFIKVHAFPREQALKEQAAKLITDAAVKAYGTDPKNVIVYFFDRNPTDAFHAGVASA